MNPTSALSSPSSDTKNHLAVLLRECMVSNATDLHIHRMGGAFLRVMNSLVRATIRTVTDERGQVPGEIFDEMKTALFEGCNDDTRTRVFRYQSLPDSEGRSKGMQCRVQFERCSEVQQLILRLQLATPPDISSILRGASQATLKLITESKGLNLVLGPIGGGKTTFAAGVARLWADQGRNIRTMEDPVEYRLTSQFGIISQQDVQLTGFSKGLPLEEAILKAFRADIDGLYIGETRNAETLRAAMDFARTHEPVITTFHAGSAGDGVASLLNTSGMNWNMACSTVGSVLNWVAYIALAFTKFGVPVPVIMLTPFNDTIVRGAIQQGDYAKMVELINGTVSGDRNVIGAISWKEAKERAIAAGATEDSVMKALPAIRK